MKKFSKAFNDPNITPDEKAEARETIVQGAIKFLIGLLSMFLAGDEFEQAINDAKAELDRQAEKFKAEGAQQANYFEVLDAGLDVTSAALDLAGKEAAANVVERIDSVVEKLAENGGKHPFISAISGWLEKKFEQKKEAREKAKPNYLKDDTGGGEVDKNDTGGNEADTGGGGDK